MIDDELIGTDAEGKSHVIIGGIFFGTKAPPWARASSFSRFLDRTQRRSTVGRTPLDE